MLKTVPWNLVDIKALGLETEHDWTVFEGTESDISNYLKGISFTFASNVGYDLFLYN